MLSTEPRAHYDLACSLFFTALFYIDTSSGAWKYSMSVEFGTLYHEISHLLVENNVFSNPQCKWQNRQPGSPKKSTVGVVQMVYPCMAMDSKATCTMYSKNDSRPVEYAWGTVHPNTLKMDTCAMYMQSRPCDNAGILLFGNGDVFQGCIEANRVQGAGIYYFVNGDSLHGLFTRGRPSGNMVYVWKNRDTSLVHYDERTAACTSVLQICLGDEVYKVVSETRSPSQLRLTLTLEHIRSLGISRTPPNNGFINTFQFLFISAMDNHTRSYVSREVMC